MKGTNSMFDIIIIGSGPAGLSAAIYAKRYGLDVLVNNENCWVRNKTEIDKE